MGKSFAYEEWAVGMAVVAREYCGRLPELVEEGHGEALRAWLLSFLPLLYYRATRMRMGLLRDLDYELGEAFTPLEQARLETALRGALREGVEAEHGERDQIFEGLEEEADALAESLVGPLLVIFRSLYDALVHYRDGETARMERALASMCMSFYGCWGGELLEATRALWRWYGLRLGLQEGWES